MSMVFFVYWVWFIFFFFFQAEDGIRDGRVTGVQTCALPIFAVEGKHLVGAVGFAFARVNTGVHVINPYPDIFLLHIVISRRSEERRVGKECRSRWSP